MRTAMKTAFEIALDQHSDELAPSPEEILIEREEQWLDGNETLEKLVASGLKKIGAYDEDASDLLDEMFELQPRNYN